MKRLPLLLLLGLIAGCSDSDSDATATKMTRWQPIELTLAEPITDPNPFDTEGTTVAAEFQNPDGQIVTVPAFVWRDYERALIGGYEHVTPTSEPQWRVRFAPAEVGNWQWRWRIHDDNGERLGEWTRFSVSEASVDDHGLVRRSPRDARYLELDDGTPFFAVGENMCWYDGRGTFAYDEWIARMAEQGSNYLRLWMPSWAFGLEAIQRNQAGEVVSSSLGNYSERLDRAWQLDYVIELARRHGIYVMLSIQSHGAFSLTNNSDWVNNPYNAANGGPLSRPRDFFSNTEARELFKRRLRYIVSRWGYATNVMTWELWNEVDLVDQPPIGDVVAWHQEMAGELRDLDPHDRLISTSTSQGDATNPTSPFNALWGLPEIDYSQAHFYSFAGAATDFTQVFPRIYNRLQRFGKPVFIGEAGVDFRGPAETIEVDPEADGFHDLLWAAVFSQTFGIGMSWWWDNVVDPEDLYFHFGPLAHLVENIDFAAEGLVAATSTQPAGDGRSLRVFSLRGAATTLVWIKNAAHLWHSPDPAPIEAAHVTIEGLAAGLWRGRWIDTRSGVETPIEIEVDGASTDFEVPAFARDVALRLERQGGGNR